MFSYPYRKRRTGQRMIIQGAPPTRRKGSSVIPLHAERRKDMTTTRLPDDLSDEAAKSLMREKTEKSLPAEAQKAKAGVVCYECEEAKRHVGKAKNHWLRKGFDSQFIYWFFIILAIGLGMCGPSSWELITGDREILGAPIAFIILGTFTFLISAALLAFKFHQEISKGFSLYYFKTADGVLHAHLKSPEGDIVKTFPLPIIAKIGVCGWFRKSRIFTFRDKARVKFAKVGDLIYAKSSKIIHLSLNDYQGLKLHKARCDKETLELSEVVLKDSHNDRITFTDINRLFDFLEKPCQVSELPSKVKDARAVNAELVEKMEKKDEELKTAQAETDKYKEIARMYAWYEQNLIQWIEVSRDNPNLGKSKHAQAIKQRLLVHQRTIKNTYGDLLSIRLTGEGGGTGR